MNVLGLDLSLTAPGLCVGGHWETLRTDAKRGDKRLSDIRGWLAYYVSEYRPVLSMIEAVPPYMTNTASLERVHGVAREVLAWNDVPFAYVSPMGVKLFMTGDGHADKAAMIDAVEAETGKRPGDDNQADAWVLQRMGQVIWADPFFHRGHHLKALSSIEWPLKPDDPTWPDPYSGKTPRKPVIRKCRHGNNCLKNGDHWLHPFTLDRCDKPPK